MTPGRTFPSGSHAAQSLLRRGKRPNSEFGSDLVFPADGEESDAPPIADYVLARHHERRYYRYMRYAFVGAVLSIAALLWYIPRQRECIYYGMCFNYGWSGVDTLGIVCVALVLLGGAMLLGANRHRHRAAELEELAFKKNPPATGEAGPFRWPEG